MDLRPLKQFTEVADAVKEALLTFLDYKQMISIMRTYWHTLLLGALPENYRKSLYPSYHADLSKIVFGYSYLEQFQDLNGYDGQPFLLPELDVTKVSKQPWWLEYAVAFTALELWKYSKEGKKCLSKDKIDKALQAKKDEMDKFAYLYYMDEYCKTQNLVMKWIFHDLAIMGKKAMEQYRDVLLKCAPVQAIWASEGKWPDMRQNIYHHYIKLCELLLSPAGMNQLIEDLIQEGLPVPEDLGPDVWYKCKEFMGGDSWITSEELDPYCKDAMCKGSADIQKFINQYCSELVLY